MAQHRPVTLPPPGLARAIHLAALHALTPPSVVWQTAAAGWTRLTPAP